MYARPTIPQIGVRRALRGGRDDLLFLDGERLDPADEERAVVEQRLGLRRYVQSHIVEERRRPDIPAHEVEIDGIAELWYDDRAAMARAHASPEARILFADGALFIGRIKAFVVDEKVMV